MLSAPFDSILYSLPMAILESFSKILRAHSGILKLVPKGLVRMLSHVSQENFSILKNFPLLASSSDFFDSAPSDWVSVSLIGVGAWIIHGVFTQSACIQQVPRSVRTMLNTTLIKASQVASDQINVRVLCAFKRQFCGLLIFKITIQIITVINSDPFSI